MSEIMKIIDERETQKRKNNKKIKQKQKRTRGKEAIVKEWELNDFVVSCCGAVQMTKIMRFVNLFNMFLNPSFKMTASFANIVRTTASTSKFMF